MNKNLLVILTFLAIAYAGCKDNAYAPPAPSPADSYFPETIGSTWTYRDSIYGEKTNPEPLYGVNIDTKTFTINGGSTDFNSYKCYNADILSSLNGARMLYFYADKHIYAFYESNPSFGFTLFQVLVDNATVGYTWTTDPIVEPSSSPFGYTPVRTVNTILEKDITKVVGGKTFTNVIHTSVNFQTNVDGTEFHNVALIHFYLAKGVGLIEKDSYFYGDFNSTETILDYKIK